MPPTCGGDIWFYMRPVPLAESYGSDNVPGHKHADPLPVVPFRHHTLLFRGHYRVLSPGVGTVAMTEDADHLTLCDLRQDGCNGAVVGSHEREGLGLVTDMIEVHGPRRKLAPAIRTRLILQGSDKSPFGLCLFLSAIQYSLLVTSVASLGRRNGTRFASRLQAGSHSMEVRFWFLQPTHSTGSHAK